MKRTKVVSLMIMACLVLSSLMIFANNEQEPLKVYLNDRLLVFEDVKPVIKNNRTLVPLRGLFEEIGITVDWNDSKKYAILSDEAYEVLLEVDNKAALVNGKINVFDSQTVIEDGRVLVPLRFITETFGYGVEWDDKTRSIYIDSTNRNQVGSETLPIVKDEENLAALLHYNKLLKTYLYGYNTMIDAGGIAPQAIESKVSDDYSNTNNQVEGVEEGDLVKTDGAYIYVIKGHDIKIIKALENQLGDVVTLKVENAATINAIYLDGTRLIVIGRRSVSEHTMPPIKPDMGDLQTDVTPQLIGLESVDGMKMHINQNTFVKAYDMTDIDAPMLISDYEFEGSYVTSRMIDDKVYMVTNKQIYDDYYYNRPYLIDDTEKTAASNYEGVAYYNHMDQTNNKLTLRDTYYFPDAVESSYLITIGIDIGNNEVDVNAYLGHANNVYVSNEHLYVAMAHYSYLKDETAKLYEPRYEVFTNAYQFDLEGGEITYNNHVKVKGSINNQFSMDEYNHNFRIATTSSSYFGNEEMSNNLYVYDESLNQIGVLEDLAEGERIYSTRFSDDRVYIVTFKQVDPFFVIDASIPSDLKVLGYLKVPGFSTYMHVLDNNHILGFGKETVENNGSVTTGGVKISLFDVTDVEKPIEKQKEVIGRSGTYTPLETDHKALMISLEKGVMGLPVNVATKSYRTLHSSAYIYNITNDSFTFKGTLPEADEGEIKINKYPIKRVIYIGDFLYTITDHEVSMYSINDLSEMDKLEY